MRRGQATYNPTTIFVFGADRPNLSCLSQDKKIQDTIRNPFFIDRRLYKEWAFTKNALYIVLLFLFNCIYRHHGHFPSLYVFPTIKFQNFSEGILTLFVFVLIYLVWFPNMKYGTRIVLRWVASFLPPLVRLSFFKRLIFSFWIPIQSCLQSNLVFILVVYVWIDPHTPHTCILPFAAN